MRFVPLEAGNYWEYVLGANTFDPSASEIPMYISLSIEVDTLINDIHYWVFDYREFDRDRQETCSREVGVNVVDSTGMSNPDLPGLPFGLVEHGVGCMNRSGPHPMFLGPLSYVLQDTAIVVSGIRFPIDQVGGYHYHARVSGGRGGGTDRFYAADIGLYYHKYTSYEPGILREFEYHLSFAYVNERSYGLRSVSVGNESAPGATPFQSVSIYPNPFRNHFRISMDDSHAPERVTYEIWDVLGRIVARGTGSTPVDVELPPGSTGLYFVQVRTSEGVQYLRSQLRISL